MPRIIRSNLLRRNSLTKPLTVPRRSAEGIYGFLAEGGIEMSGLYQLPGLFLTALCHVIIIYYMSEHKYSKKKFMFYGCIYGTYFIALMAYGYTAGGMYGLFSYVGIAAGLFLFSCVVSRDCFSKKCFMFISYFCLFSVLDNIFKIMVNLLLPRLSAPAGYYMAIVLRSLACLLILALYKKYAAPILRSVTDINRGRWWNLALIALLFYLLQVVVSVLNISGTIPKMHLLVILAVVSFIMCAVYGIVFSNISYMKKDAEAALVRQNAAYLSNRLSALQDAEETYRRLRHDMRHHLETIAEYARGGDSEAVLAYIREYSIEISETAIRQYALNKTINSILSVYAGKAGENDIDFSARCNAPAELTVRDIDLIALLGNLLENALHGCQKSGKERPGIEIRIRVYNNRLIMICNNTCPDDLVLSGGLPTGKSIGISSILAVCRKYDGNLDYQVENGICSACVILNL